MSNTILDLLAARVSCSQLDYPAPNNNHINQAMACAMAVPDHGRLKPWQFIVVEGQEKLEQLGQLFAKAKAMENPNETSDVLDRVKSLPLRAPMLIIGIAKITEHPKVPAIEQVVSAGCAIYAMQLALDSQGFASYWRTGDLTANKHLKRLLNLTESDEIVGFLYVGTAKVTKNEREAADTTSTVRYF